MADGGTKFPNGAAIIIDNDVCMSLEQMHKRVDAVGLGGAVYDIDLDSCFDHRGNPLSADKRASIRAGDGQ